MARSHQALSSSGDVQVDFQEVDTAQDVHFSHPSPQLTLYGTKEGNRGQARSRGKIKRRGLQRVTERSWFSPQAPAKDPGPGRSCMATGLTQLQSCLLGAMYSNVREKSNGLGIGISGTELGFAEPRWKDRGVQPPSKLPFLGPSAPELRQGHLDVQARPVRGHPQSSHWSNSQGLKQTHCPDNPDGPQTLVPGSAFLSSGQRGTLAALGLAGWAAGSSEQRAAMSKPTKVWCGLASTPAHGTVFVPYF